MTMSCKRLTCLSLNVNGLQDIHKRPLLCDFLLRSRSTDSLRHDVVMLQETHHATESELHAWLQAGAGRGRPIAADVFHAVGSTASAGVVMLFAKHLHASNFAVVAAVEGRLLVVTCDILGQPFCFVNVYAPHDPAQRIAFFSTVLYASLPAASALANSTCVWGGDWNCIECPLLDQSGPSQAREQGFHDALAPVIADYGMHDAFRCMHPSAPTFSFSRVTAGYSTFSRLDRFYVSDSAVPLLHAATYEESLPSHGIDHRACTMSLRIPDAPCMGPGVWSFPQHLLWDDVSMQRIRRVVSSWLVAHPVGSDGTAVGRWLELKLMLKHQSILAGMQYSQAQAQRRRLADRRARLLADRWAAAPASTFHAAAYHSASLHASSLKEQSARKAAKLAGAAWSDFGESCTAWFHRLGQQRKQATVIASVKARGASDSVDLQCSSGVAAGADIIADFFDSEVQGSLFFPGEVDQAAQQELLGALDRALSAGDRAVCEADLTIAELGAALKDCATSKRPGLDGLPYELYSALWDVLGQPLLDAWVECMAAPDPQLPQEMVQGCIVLIYKGQGDREDLGNYRPITLLNADYKLVAKAYARRFGGPAATVVDSTQTAFLPGAWIGDNVLHHLEEVDFCEATRQPGCILFLDFAKAYDRMDRPWILQCMGLMGFGPRAQGVVRCLLHGTTAVCVFNGHLTRSFAVSSGVAQGSPLSPLLYVLAAQPLAARVRQLQQQGAYDAIRQPDGQPAPGSQQHADDTTLHAATADDAEVIVERAVEPFCRATNARLNAGKTKVLLLGGATAPATPPASGIIYPTPGAPVVAVRHLGIMLAPGAVGTAAREAKFVSIEGAMRSRMSHWSRHSLSALGRAHVAKQCLASMFVYHAMFSMPSEAVLSRLDRSIAAFVHEGAMHPNRSVHQLPRELGGISLACIPAAACALRAHVVQKYLCGDRKPWHSFWDFWLGSHPAPWPRHVDRVQYGARLLLLPVNLQLASARIPQRVLHHVHSFRQDCGLSRVTQPASLMAVLQEPVFYNLSRHASPVLPSHFVHPHQFAHLAAAGVRIIADLHNLWVQRASLPAALLQEVQFVYSCLPAAWQQLLPQHLVPVPALSLPTASFEYAGGVPFQGATVRALTHAALSVRALSHGIPLPVRPAHWHGHAGLQQQHLSSIESRWTDWCERGTVSVLGRRVRDSDQYEAVRAGAAWIDDGRRNRPSRPAPRERNEGTSAQELLVVPPSPEATQSTRGPSVMGPTAMHTSCWCRLSVSYIHETQPLPPWDACWKSLWGGGLTRESAWVLWRLAHGALPCGARQRYLDVQARRQEVSEGRCKQGGCEDKWDTLTHGFLECPVIARVWQWVAQLYSHLAGGQVPPLTIDVLVCGVTRPVWSPRSRLWYLFRAAAVTCIHAARSRSHRSGLPLSCTRIACRIVIHLRAQISSDWIASSKCLAVRRLYGTPAPNVAARQRRFRQRWLSHPSLCSVTAGVLAVHLTPHHPVPVPVAS
jgi:exonuclease III